MKTSVFESLLIFTLSLAAAVAAGVQPARSQDAHTYILGPDSKIWIDGTSNKSDWTVTATALSGTIAITSFSHPDDAGIETAQVTVPAAKILSDKSVIMDRLMHKALATNQYPDINYVLSEVDSVTVADDGRVTMRAAGTLTIKSVAKDISITLHGEAIENGRYRFVGNHDMRMTEFGIKPPTAMFGALHTADPVVVHFDVVTAAEGS